MKMNIEQKLNKSVNFLENKKINLSPIKDEKNEIKSKEMLNNNYNSPCRLDFYALGKVNNYPEIINKKSNNSFRSGSNNLLIRNYLSVNSPTFDDIKKKIPKKLMTIFHQNLEENNYLEPYSPFNFQHKYDIPNNSTNQEMYNMAKKKLYIKGFPSSVKQGKQINKIDFSTEKKKLININSKIISPSTNITNTIREKFYNKIKLYENPLNIKEKEREEKENDCDNIIQEKFGNKKLLHSLSSNLFKPITPFNLKQEVLKANDIHVERNHNRILRSRNWWKVE